MKSDRRPYILLNYALSLDGKLSTEQRDPVRFTSRIDRGLMDEIRADADAVLIGAGTLRAEDPPVRIKSARRRDERRRMGKSPHPVSVILSRSMRLPGAGRYWEMTTRSNGSSRRRSRRRTNRSCPIRTWPK